MARRLTPRGEERRRQLLAFATRRFAENGYHPTSVAEIVQGIGVGKGVFYWYFDSKEELFLEILRDAQQDLRRAQRRALSEAADPVQRIELGIRASIDWFATHRDLYTLTQFAVTEERFQPALRKGQEVALRDVSRHVQEAIEAGEIRDMDPAYIANGILGVTAQLARELIHNGRHPAGDVADAAVVLVLDGVRAR